MNNLLKVVFKIIRLYSPQIKEEVFYKLNIFIVLLAEINKNKANWSELWTSKIENIHKILLSKDYKIIVLFYLDKNE